MFTAILARYGFQIVGVLAVIACLAFGYNWAYGRGEASGRAIVQKAWDREAAEIARQRALQEAEARAKEERDSRTAREIQDELQSRLHDADSRARELARRLSDFQARDRARRLSEAAGAPASPDGTPGVPEDGGAVGQLLEEHIAACARDAERLSGWQEWWARVQ